MHTENFGCIGGQRAVNVNRDVRNETLIMKFMQGINNLLCAPYSKGRDQQDSTPIIGTINYTLHVFFRFGIGRMQAITVGAFHYENICTFDQISGIANDRYTFPSYIAAEDEPVFTTAILVIDIKNYMGGAQHMSGIDQGQIDTRNNFVLTIVADADEVLHGIDHILFCIERLK